MRNTKCICARLVWLTLIHFTQSLLHCNCRCLWKKLTKKAMSLAQEALNNITKEFETLKSAVVLEH